MQVQQNAGLAVVTGASSGLGVEFARQLAMEGNDLLIIARRTDRLQQLATELETAHGVVAHVLTLDLADENSAKIIEAKVQEIGKPLRWLINNAGYGLIGNLDAFPASDHQRFIRVLGMTPIETSLQLLPLLQQAAPSYIVNVASLAAFLPGVPGAGLYPGIKSLLFKFSETLAAEQRRNGITVTVSCPGLTETEIFDHHPDGVDAAFRNGKSMSPKVVVREALAAAKAGKGHVIHGGRNSLMASLFRHLPPSLARSIVARHFAPD